MPNLEARFSPVLGVYVDGPYALVETPDGPRVAPDRADLPFLSFVAEVGRSFGGTVLFGRCADASPGPRAAGQLVLPAGVTLQPLPPYEALGRVGQVLRAAAGTVRGFWRGLARVDVVWVTGPHPFAFVLVALALLRGRAVVLGVRQDTAAYFRSRVTGRLRVPLLAAGRAMDAGFRALARALPTVVVGSEIERVYGGPRAGLLAVTISLLHGADVVDRPQPRDWGGTVQLVTVGRIDREKNPFLLLDALAALERARPGRYRLAWAGTGPLEDAVRARAQALGLGAQIEFLGFTPFSELVARYRAAHLFVHVSLTEGVPAVLFEALASGTPVVATDVGGVSGALLGGRAGMLVPPADLDAIVGAIQRLTDDRALYDQLAARGLELAKAITLESQAQLIADFATASLDGRRPSYLAARAQIT